MARQQWSVMLCHVNSEVSTMGCQQVCGDASPAFDRIGRAPPVSAIERFAAAALGPEPAAERTLPRTSAIVGAALEELRAGGYLPYKGCAWVGVRTGGGTWHHSKGGRVLRGAQHGDTEDARIAPIAAAVVAMHQTRDGQSERTGNGRWHRSVRSVVKAVPEQHTPRPTR